MHVPRLSAGNRVQYEFYKSPPKEGGSIRCSVLINSLAQGASRESPMIHQSGHDLLGGDESLILRLRLLIARAANKDSLAWWEDESLTSRNVPLLSIPVPQEPIPSLEVLRQHLEEHLDKPRPYSKVHV